MRTISMSKLLAAALCATLTAAPLAPAMAWEARTTSAGVAEQAALGSGLHKRLVALGFGRGLFEPLIIPPADAPALFEALRLLPPSDGAQPDARGQQAALAWLAAGAVLADANAADAANHFFDPTTGLGFRRPRLGALATMSAAIRERISRTPLPSTGVPAPDWAASSSNPLGRPAFVEQYAKAVRAATPGERARHLASALLAAGSLVHVLADMGSPSHVRGDGLAHLDRIGPGVDDLGSRFERLAALGYGRLGVPSSDRVVSRDTLRGFFTSTPAGAARGTAAATEPLGLADEVAGRFFSAYTLPGSFQATQGAASARLARPAPTLPLRLSVMAASQPGGTLLRDERGVCLARYVAERGTVSFTTDDDCLLEQIGAVLPDVVAYATGLLEFLFRGDLVVTVASGAVTVAGATGAVELLAEDARGVRTPLAAGAAPPAGTTRVIALSVGVDAKGEPLIAVGAAAIAP
jgi:hypothetical protein